MGNRDRVFGICAVGTCVLLVLATVGVFFADYAMADPPANQDYVGAKTCASCHFEQFMTWKKTKHAQAFDALPAKYKAEAKCLKCHTTGYGTSTGFKDESTKNLAGISCEMCHGAGSEHAKVCNQYKNNKELTEDEEKAAKGSIWLMRPENICVNCHNLQSHKVHEKYDEE